MTKLQLAREALKRYREDLRAGHLAAAEYWRGQASAFFVANPIDPRVESEINRYVNLIRNADKRRYAGAYVNWLRNGAVGYPPDKGKLSYMAAQAVRLHIDSMKPWGNPRSNPVGLYQSFHGSNPARTRPVQLTVPKRLVKIGRLKELVYAPEKPSRLTGNHFNHKFGDHGYKFVRGQEPVLAVSEDGKQLVIVEGSYRFGARGIVG